MSSAALGKEVCPHLGMPEDSRTCLAYPSAWNHCHHARPAATVKLEYQRTTCLLAVHTACPVFQAARVGRLPASLRGRRKKSGAGKLTTLLVLSVLALGFLFWVVWGRQAEFPSGTAAGIPQGPIPPDSPQQVKPTLAPASIETKENNPLSFQMTQAASAPTSVRYIPSLGPLKCGYELEDKVESGRYALLIHHVARGESMDLLAAKYNTSLGAIRAVNHFLPSPLWKDLVIVIPVGVVSGDSLPVVEPYQVQSPGMSIQTLAAQLSVPPEALIKTNELEASCQELSGWVLVPHRAPKKQ